MGKRELVAAAALGMFSAGYSAANAQQPYLLSGIPNGLGGLINLYSTATDWGGSYEATSVAAYTGELDGNVREHVNASTGQVLSADQSTVLGEATPDVASQIGWNGWGAGANYPNPINDPILHETPGKYPIVLTYSPAEATSVYASPNLGVDIPGGGDLDGSTVNGLGNYDNSGNDSTTPDAYAFTPQGEYAGRTSPAGGLTFVYSGGFASVTSGELGGNAALLNAVGFSGTFYISFTLPGGATDIASLLAANPGSKESYFGLGLRVFDPYEPTGVKDLGLSHMVHLTFTTPVTLRV